MSFYTDLQRGRKGEKLVAEALTAKGHTVEDVSMALAYQFKDIDFVITKDGASTTLEVKNDLRSNQTGNIFVEETNYNNVRRNYKGWLYYSEAVYFCFLQEEHGKAHIIHHDDLLSLVKSGKYRYTASIDTRGFVIPIDDVKQCRSYYCLEVGNNDK